MFDKNGIIVLNKPTGMSSSLAVSIVKRILRPNKIGHLGTLDPLGTGVLLLAINKGTKLFDLYLTKRKTYKTIFKFGIETDTFDSEGNIVKEQDCDISFEDVIEKTKMLIGEMAQMPPMYSAKKVAGKKAYELAREGKTVELKPRNVVIHRFDCLGEVEKNTFMFEIECSAGTYIRSLCRDLATLLSTCGTMVYINRTTCGVFGIEQSSTLEQIRENDFVFYETNEKGEVIG